MPKHDERVIAYGTVDELNAMLGVAIAADREGSGTAGLRDIQADLLTIGALLAAADPERAKEKRTVPELPIDRVSDLEAWIDRLDAELEPLDAFILPGGSPAGAHLHVARTVCRRAERAITPLLDIHPELGDAVIPYVNRLSDLLFMLARSVNTVAGAK
ncbi:MAG: cob(I)yrinic acid a,c-diamide adenosyltransferase, partial [Gemmatimonadota bacterium]